MQKIDEKTWEAVRLTEIFDTISRGKRIKKSDHIPGDVPYVSSTALANGTDGSCGNEKNVRKFGDCLTLANSGSVGILFPSQTFLIFCPESAWSQQILLLETDHLSELWITATALHVL